MLLIAVWIQYAFGKCSHKTAALFRIFLGMKKVYSITMNLYTQPAVSGQTGISETLALYTSVANQVRCLSTFVQPVCFCPRNLAG